MSEFELRLPYRSRDDRFNLGEVGDLTREAISDPQERQVVRGVMFEIATEPGIETYGDALDRLEAAGVEGRRELVDAARRREGLPSLAQEEGHRAFEAANSQLMPGRDSEGRILQRCAATNCGVFPIGPEGFPVPTSDRRWWCDSHKHLAAEGDDHPPSPRYVLDPATFSLVAVVGRARGRTVGLPTTSRRRPTPPSLRFHVSAIGRNANAERSRSWRRRPSRSRSRPSRYDDDRDRAVQNLGAPLQPAARCRRERGSLGQSDRQCRRADVLCPAEQDPDTAQGSGWRTAAISPRNHVRVLTMVGRFEC
jgi:hypothetical protein